MSPPVSAMITSATPVEMPWQLRVHVGTDPLSGRKRYVSKTFHGTKRQTGRVLAELVAETGGFVPRQDRESTFSRLLEEWLEQPAPSLSPKTVVVDGGYVRTVILPAVGAIPVRQRMDKPATFVFLLPEESAS